MDKYREGKNESLFSVSCAAQVSPPRHTLNTFIAVHQHIFLITLSWASLTTHSHTHTLTPVHNQPHQQHGADTHRFTTHASASPVPPRCRGSRLSLLPLSIFSRLAAKPLPLFSGKYSWPQFYEGDTIKQARVLYVILQHLPRLPRHATTQAAQADKDAAPPPF